MATGETPLASTQAMPNRLKIYLRDLRRMVTVTVAPPIAALCVAWLIGVSKIMLVASVAAIVWMLLATATFSILLLSPRRDRSNNNNNRRKRPSERTA